MNALAIIAILMGCAIVGFLIFKVVKAMRDTFAPRYDDGTSTGAGPRVRDNVRKDIY